MTTSVERGGRDNWTRRRPAPRERSGSVEFERASRGMSPQRQRQDSPAPTPVGWWAFPGGWFNWYFAHHKFNEVVPKDLVNGTGWSGRTRPDDFDAARATERDRWIDATGHTVLRRHRFWWAGPVWSSLGPNGKPVAAWHERQFVMCGSAVEYLALLRRAVARDVDPDFFEVWLCAADGKPLGRPER